MTRARCSRCWPWRSCCRWPARCWSRWGWCRCWRAGWRRRRRWPRLSEDAPAPRGARRAGGLRTASGRSSRGLLTSRAAPARRLDHRRRRGGAAHRVIALPWVAVGTRRARRRRRPTRSGFAGDRRAGGSLEQAIGAVFERLERSRPGAGGRRARGERRPGGGRHAHRAPARRGRAPAGLNADRVRAASCDGGARTARASRSNSPVESAAAAEAVAAAAEAAAAWPACSARGRPRWSSPGPEPGSCRTWPQEIRGAARVDPRDRVGPGGQPGRAGTSCA